MENLQYNNSTSRCIRCGKSIGISRSFEKQRLYYCSLQCNLRSLWIGYLFFGYFGFIWSEASFERISSKSTLDMFGIWEGTFHFGLNLISLLLFGWGIVGTIVFFFYQIYNRMDYQSDPRNQHQLGLTTDHRPIYPFILHSGGKQIFILIFILVFYFILDWNLLSVITRNNLVNLMPKSWEVSSLDGSIPTFLLNAPFPFIEASRNTPGIHFPVANGDYFFIKSTSLLMVPAIVIPLIAISNARTAWKMPTMFLIFLLTVFMNIIRLLVLFTLLHQALTTGTNPETAFYQIFDAPHTLILAIFLFLTTGVVEILGIPLLDSLAELFLIPRDLSSRFFRSIRGD